MIPITTVGSREVKDKKTYTMLSLVGRRIVQAKGMVREGNAGGTDKAFQTGALDEGRILGELPRNVRLTILPALKSRGAEHNPDEGIYGFPLLPHRDLAYKIAALIHPAWENCNDFAKDLHSRNVYQVMGKDLLDPSYQLFCYAPPTSEGSITGGTRTAFELAKMLGIPRANFYMTGKAEDGTDLTGDFNNELAKRYFPVKGTMLLDVPELIMNERLLAVVKNYGLINPDFYTAFRAVYKC